MLVNGKNYITIWTNKDKSIVYTIDQRLLPHKFRIIKLKNSDDVILAIKNMTVRGAPLIGVAAAYGMYLAVLEAKRKFKSVKEINKYLILKSAEIKSTRPTAVNLFYAVEESLKKINNANTSEEKKREAINYAESLLKTEIDACRRIGMYGLKIIETISKKKKGGIVNILTHCNAGWLACIDYGTATAPIYFANERGIKVHVWVEETRPRNQGAGITAWELGQNSVPHTIITDNAGGYVLQKGLVDLVITGSDRTTITGDVCNKIGTYKTALAAYDNRIPFYAAVPTSSIDRKIKNGIKEIRIEERNENEVKRVQGKYKNRIIEVLITPEKSLVKNYGFDITPRKYVTGIITEKGICRANEKNIKQLLTDNFK
jgi:methylthioribose-1-phosphate isomerase